MTTDLRFGAWETALANVKSVDAVICDPPYSDKTHKGHDGGANLANRKGSAPRADGGKDRYRARREISYTAWGPTEIEDFVKSWAPRNRGWFVCLSDSILCNDWRASFENHGLTAFQPVPLLIRGMTVRMCGDGPSSWCVYANVARPKQLHKWGTLPGYYETKPGDRTHIGGRPMDGMRAFVRDYTRRGDLVCDPCAGAATTLLAARLEGRNAIGAEVDPDTFEVGAKRLDGGFTPSFDFGATGSVGEIQ